MKNIYQIKVILALTNTYLEEYLYTSSICSRIKAMEINMTELESILSQTGETKMAENEDMQTFQHMTMDDIIEHMEDTFEIHPSETVYDILLLCGFSKWIDEGYLQISKNKSVVEKWKRIFKIFQQFVDAQIEF